MLPSIPGDSITRLVIPAFIMSETGIAVFKTDHHKHFRNDHASQMWKVARSPVSVRIESGDLLLPEDAPWLDLLERELLGLPTFAAVAVYRDAKSRWFQIT